MIKQPACERKCRSPLDLIAVGYCHAEERDVVISGSSPLSCLLNAPSTADIFEGVAGRRHGISVSRHRRRACGNPRKESPAIASQSLKLNGGMG